jgi:hypothetical protein
VVGPIIDDLPSEFIRLVANKRTACVNALFTRRNVSDSGITCEYGEHKRDRMWNYVSFHVRDIKYCYVKWIWYNISSVRSSLPRRLSVSALKPVTWCRLLSGGKPNDTGFVCEQSGLM